MSERSLAQEIFRAVTSKEMDMQTGMDHMAHLVANTLTDHPVRTYPAMSEHLAGYVRRRRDGLDSYDAHWAKKNGEWLFAVRNIVRLNFGDVDTLSWAALRCKGKGSDADARKIQMHLKRHLDNRVPDMFRDALHVQELDSGESRHSAQD